MKSFLLALVLVPIGVFGSSSSSFSTIFGDKKDAGSVMAKLQDMMGQSQHKLQVAQRHHAKVVKKMRTQATAWLQDEANVYGKYFNGYAVEMNQVEAELREAVDEAKAGIAASDKASERSVNDWKDPVVEQRAKLGAQVAAAERSIKKNERRTARKVEESEEHSEEVMEDHGTKLGFKLGDMTPVVDEAKKTLHAVADKAVPALKVVAKVDAAKKVDLKALEDKVAKASKSVITATAAANKKLDGFLTKTDKEVGDKRAVIEKNIQDAQTAEIAKVLGKKAAVPVAKKEAVKAAKVVKAVAKVVKTAAKVETAKVVKTAAKVETAKVVKTAAKVETAKVVKTAAVVKPVVAKK